jgi:hypothetical protein
MSAAATIRSPPRPLASPDPRTHAKRLTIVRGIVMVVD